MYGLKERKWWLFALALFTVSWWNFDYSGTGIQLMLIFYLCRNHPGIGAGLYALSYLPALWTGWPEDPLCLTVGNLCIDWSVFALLALPLIFCRTHSGVKVESLVLLRLLSRPSGGDRPDPEYRVKRRYHHADWSKTCTNPTRWARPPTRCSRACPSRWRRGSSWPSWAPPAPARPRCSTASPATSPSTVGRSPWGRSSWQTSARTPWPRSATGKLGFVFQDFLLLDGLTVRENILLPAIIGGTVNSQVEERADQLCDVFGIGHIRSKYPAEISGGEKQRTAVARALINRPLLILAGRAPPATWIPSPSRGGDPLLLSRPGTPWRPTIFMVTHDSFAASFCDRGGDPPGRGGVADAGEGRHGPRAPSRTGCWTPSGTWGKE